MEDNKKINIKLDTSILESIQPTTNRPAAPAELAPVPNNTELPAVVYKPAYAGPVQAKEQAEQSLISVARALDPNVSEEAIEKIRGYVSQVQRGSATALPLVCKGLACEFLHVCKLHELKIPLPVGKKCPLETELVAFWVNKHLKFLGIEDIDAPENSFDMDMLYELATQELIKYRCSAYLAKNPIVDNKVVAESFNGTPIFADVMNPVMEAMEKAGRNVSKIRDALLATRKSQVTAGQVILDSTEHAAKLKERAKGILNKRIMGSKEDIKEAEFRLSTDEPDKQIPPERI